jgi:energy-coupling factor transporter ATP-binding protein EcfA2
MYVNRMRLFNVKPLHRCIPTGGGALPESAHRRLLLQGANGSGKTTILETISTLWRFWGEWIDEGPGSPPPEEQLNHYLASADLAAVEFVGIPNTPALWIGTGKLPEWQALGTTYPGATTAGLVWSGEMVFQYPDPAASGEPHAPLWFRTGPSWDIQLPPGDFLARRQRSLAGSESFPNVVYFPPEGRTIRPPDRPRGEIIDTTRFNWTAVYDPTINLDSVLLTVKALSPDRFDECLRLVNLALGHRQKRITGFGPKGRLIVAGTTESGVSYQHPIEELSSGERQILLLVGFVVAFLRPGGILLVDEPDLHIHRALVAQLLETLELVVKERQGQIIVASHSQLVWDWFSRDEERVELSPWQGVPT